MKGLAKEHIFLTHGHRQQCGDGLGRKDRGWVEAGKVGTSAIVSTIQNNTHTKKTGIKYLTVLAPNLPNITPPSTLNPQTELLYTQL